VQALLAEEHALGMTEVAFYTDFGQRVRRLGAALSEQLAELKAAGNTIVAYGASAKGSTLLNVFGIGRETLDYVVDRSPDKQGRLTPGTHLQILPPERLLQDQPEYALLLTWNFLTEILRQQASWHDGGGRFIIPIPQPHIR
jgi:hypothetical protein